MHTNKTNVEKTNVEKTNVEKTNVEKTNVEKTNVEKTNNVNKINLPNKYFTSFIILPDQLYFTKYSIECLSFADIIYIIEDPLYFDGFCKNKVILSRACMKYYKDVLKNYFENKTYKPKIIKYISRKKFTDTNSSSFSEYFSNIKSQVLMFYINDSNMYNNIRYKKFNGLHIKFFETPGFLLSFKYIKNTYKPNTHYEFASFYKKMRKMFINTLNPKIDNKYKPLGDKYIHEEIMGSINDLKKLCKLNIIHNEIYNQYTPHNDYILHAIKYVNKINTNNLSKINVFSYNEYPITYDDVNKLLLNFLQYKLQYYDKYNEFIVINQSKLCTITSKLSYAINIGLLTPIQLLSYTILYINKNNISIHIYEPFIRKIVGWREYMRMLYIVNANYPNYNFFKFTKKIHNNILSGNTDILPVDECIKYANEYSYLHDTQRKIICNYMLLQHINPYEINEWFRKMFIDGYEWCTYPICMGLCYSDKGILFKSFKIFLSKDILKITTYQTGIWELKWDSLYWSFVNSYTNKLKKILYSNNITSIIKQYKEKNNDERKKILELAEKNIF